MSSATQPVINPTRPSGAPRTVKEWLDSLLCEGCDQTQFLRGIGALLRKAPDSGWELLGLIDQYYRRGKVSAQMFGSLKTHLQSLMVGKASADELSAPGKTRDEPPLLTAAVATRLRPRTAAPVVSNPVPVAAPAGPKPVLAPTSTPQRLPGAAAATAAPATAAAATAAAATAAARVPTLGVEAAPRPLAVGDVLRGRYVVQALVGQGAMGTVFAAIDQYRLDPSSGDQRVAIKVLHTEVIKRPSLFAELRREFQHLQSLSHPNIVRVHEFDRDGDLAFFTMEYLSGTLLSRAISSADGSTLPRPVALAIIRDIGAAIAHAHARRIVHGDLNPGNIFITDSGEVRVLDFGASHRLRHGPWISDFESSQQIRVATPGYASCQVLDGETADARDDVFSLGCIAYLLLSGTKPFREHTATAARTLRLRPARPRGINGRQWAALRSALDFDRDRRPADVRTWLHRLDLQGAAAKLPPLPSLRTARPPPARSSAWISAPLIAASCVAGLWWAHGKDDPLAAAQAGLSDAADWAIDHAITAQLWLKNLAARTTHPTATTANATSGSPAATAVGEPPVTVPSAPSAAEDGLRENRPAADRPTPPTRPAAAPSVKQSPTQTPPTLHARIDLAADDVAVAGGDPVARVVVRRTRNLNGEVSFNWWTESGTAKPGRDFVAVKSQVEHFDDGQSALNLIVPVVVDPSRREARSFYIVIDQPSDNATLGSHTLTMVTVPGFEPGQRAQAGR